jgi:transcriptional activator HAC1
MLDSFALDNIVDKTRNTITQSNITKNTKPVSSPSVHKIEDNSAAVEDWFMDLLSGSPSAATAAADTDPVTVIGTSQVSAASSPSPSSTAASVIARSPFEWDAASSSSDEMQTLLALLPPPDVAREELAGLGLDLGAVSATEPWTWTGTTDVPISV